MDRVNKKQDNKNTTKKTNKRVNPKINKKNKKNKKYSKNDTLIKLGLLITVIVFVVIIFKILHKEKLQDERISITNNTLYQYFMGEKSEYTGKIELFKEDDDTKLVADDDITVYPDTVPIYYKDILGKAMFAKEMELVTVDEGMYKLSDYTEINTVNNDIFAKRFNKKEQKALINSFIYDGSDLYFFLDNTTVRIGETEYELSPLSYAIVNYRTNVELYNYEKDEYTIIDDEESLLPDVMAINHSGNYKINMSVDSISTEKSQYLLISTISNLNEVEY